MARQNRRRQILGGGRRTIEASPIQYKRNLGYLESNYSLDQNPRDFSGYRTADKARGNKLSSDRQKQDLERADIFFKFRKKFNNPSYLPTIAEVEEAFGCNRRAIINSCNLDSLHSDGGSYNGDLQQRRIYELWTREYIEGLSNYLLERLRTLGASKETPATILEVCAGNGKLSHYLGEKLREIAPDIANIVAIDSGEDEMVADFPVEQIAHKEALVKYQPKIVLCSWMPYGVDLSADFRATESVDEYILIGQGAGGCCGDENTFYRSDYTQEDLPDIKEGPIVDDGFDYEELPELSRLQISREKSHTFSFRRIK